MLLRAILPVAALIVMVALPAQGGTEKTVPTPPVSQFIPPSISAEAQAVYKKILPLIAAGRSKNKPPHTVAEFDAQHGQFEARWAPLSKAELVRLKVSASDTQLGGIAAVEVVPPDIRDDHSVLMYVHGGGFVSGSAHSTLAQAADMAFEAGRRVYSVEYSVAPRGNWRGITDQVIAAYRALIAQGYKAQEIGLFGDSAGGDIVAASVLKMRDEGLPLPGALVLLSPVADLTMSGDTWTTLRDAEPLLTGPGLQACYQAYASERDWKNPYVSPAYGDYSKGFPPVLIQGGTKELLLSDFVRLYRAVKAGGAEAELDLYEGMMHNFQATMPGTPEQHAAYARAKQFWDRHLAGAGGSL